MIREELETLLKKYNQEHVLKYWDYLNEKEKTNFATDLEQIDYEHLDHIYKLAMKDISSAEVVFLKFLVT